MIKTAGERLRAAQDRVKALTDVIQVSALIVESHAMQRNTAVLRQIATDFRRLYDWRFRRYAFLITGGAVFFSILNWLFGLLGKFIGWAL
jgi:hypothetical protein